MIQAGIIGGAGYTGGELIRLLLRHPECTIKFVRSRSHSNRRVSEVHKDLIGDTDLTFTNDISSEADVLFLCMGHGESKQFLSDHPIAEQTRLIDLSQDFRYTQSSDYFFIYGLPEVNRVQIMNAINVANPGCFATAIELALLPLAAKGLLKEEIHITGITGSTGAGQNLSTTTHYTWRNSNISVYKPFAHQHLREITETLKILQGDPIPSIQFLPFRGNFTRGILTTVYTKINQSQLEIEELYRNYYSGHPFVVIYEGDLDLKLVVNTNKSIIKLSQYGDILLIENIVDNLLKGASGQAVQNMNLMFGIEETCGLNLKAVAF